MIVFDLKCTAGHVFEAWFANSDAFSNQKQKGFLACPICGSSDVEKAVMAPNVAPKGNQRSAAPLPAVTAAQRAPAEVKAVLEKMAKVQAALLETSTWVGSDFAAQARAMDAGDVDTAMIHGQTTVEEAKALVDDGISIVALPFPVIPPEKQN